MSKGSKTASLLIFPQSQQEAQLTSGLWTDSASTRIPSTTGIPWLYRAPQAAIADWRLRWSAYLASLDQEIEELARELKALGSAAADSLKSQVRSRQRIENLRRAKIAHKNNLVDFLRPLELLQTEKTTQLEAMRARLPMNQSFLGYYPNLLRDWAEWGTQENATHATLCEKVIPKLGLGDSVAVIGCGAARLSYDLAPRLKAKNYFLVDIDPLLLLAAQRFFHGEKREFWDFPLQPRNSKEVAIDQVCGTGEKRQAQFILADALDLPFKPASLDALILPWALDILPAPPSEMLSYLNGFIKDGGHILFFGPTGFAHRQRQHDLCGDELPDLFADAGFNVEKIEQAVVPYMQSPFSSQQRSEWVTALCARKIKSAEKSNPPRRLPPWLEAGGSAIPLLPHFAGFMAKNQVYNQVVAEIDGLITLEDLAGKLSPKFHLPIDETRELLRNFLFQLFEETRFRAF